MSQMREQYSLTQLTSVQLDKERLKDMTTIKNKYGLNKQQQLEYISSKGE